MTHAAGSASVANSGVAVSPGAPRMAVRRGTAGAPVAALTDQSCAMIDAGALEPGRRPSERVTDVSR